MELEPGIHQMTIGREPFSGFPPPNAFLVVGTESSVLIDAGWEDASDHEARMAFLEETGAPPLAEIIITHHHPDHAGGALAVHRDTGAPMTAHALDRETIERERFHGNATIDAELKAGDTRDLGGLSLEMLFTPGHTRGCMAVYIPERGTLLSTDTVMQVSSTALRPRDGNLADYVRSLEALQGIGAKRMYGGHGGPITEPAARLRELIEHRRQREAELREALAQGPQSVTALREIIYADLPEVRHQLAEAQLTTGLQKLMDEGVARKVGERYALA